LPSLQTVPASKTLSYAQLPVARSQLSEVQGLLSLQTTVAVATHDVPLQWSPVVHLLPSSQVPPFAVCVQPPVPGHASVLHGLPSSHVGVPLPTQLPPEHVSVRVQTLPSLQVAPLITVALPIQLPVVTSQLSDVQNFPSSQFVGVPTQAPALQVSLVVHWLPSSQPPLLAVCAQPPAPGQASVVHWLPSSQLGVPVPTQTPFEQVSVSVHTLPSLHTVPTNKVLSLTQVPVARSQLSDVQNLPSSQFFVAVGRQTPPEH